MDKELRGMLRLFRNNRLPVRKRMLYSKEITRPGDNEERPVALDMSFKQSGDARIKAWMDTLIALQASAVCCPHIIELDLSRNKISRQSCASISKVMTTFPLARLVLAGNFIDDLACKLFAGSLGRHSCTLRELNLSENLLHADGVAHLLAALHSSHLTHLDLSANSIGASGWMLLTKFVDGNETLKELNVSRNFLGESGISSFALALARSRVSSLDISQNSIGMTGCITFAVPLSTNDHLEHLNMRMTSIATGCYFLAEALDCNTKLRHLDISANRLDSKSMRRLTQMLERNKALESLDVSDIHVDKECWDALFDCLLDSNKTISRFVADGNSISNNCLVTLGEAIAKNNLLRSVSLQRVHFSNKALSLFLALVSKSDTIERISIQLPYSTPALLIERETNEYSFTQWRRCLAAIDLSTHPSIELLEFIAGMTLQADAIDDSFL